MTDYLKTKAVKGAGSGNKKGGQGSNAGGGGKGKKKKERSSSNARTYARDIAYCQAVQSMCGGYFKVSPFLLNNVAVAGRTASMSRGCLCSPRPQTNQNVCVFLRSTTT